MSVPALVREADLRRLAKVVKDTGVVIEVEADGLKIRITPEHAAGPDTRPKLRNGIDYGRPQL